MTSRRQFLSVSTLAMSSLALAQVPVLARGQGLDRNLPVHLDESFVFPEWLAAMSAAGERDSDRAFMKELRQSPLTSLSPRRGVQYLTTLPAPGVEAFRPREACAIARIANDRLAERVRPSQGLWGLASVAAHGPGAVREAERAVKRLGLSGVTVGANRGLTLNDPSLFPVYEFAEDAGVPIYVPAAYASLAGEEPYRADGRAGVISGAAADSAAHLTQLIFGGVLDRFPKLAVVLARLGEGTPYWYGRLQETYLAQAQAGRTLPQQGLADYFKGRVFLTSSDMSPSTARYCRVVIGSSCVMLTSSPASKQFANSAEVAASGGALTAVNGGHLFRNA